MYLLTLILPFSIYIITSFLGRFLGHKGIFLISKYIFSLILIITLLLFSENILDGNMNTLYIGNWILIDDLNINWVYILDDLALIMLIVIFSISIIVIIYTYDYLIEDPHHVRFYSYIFLFVFCMILLITTSSLPILFIGWEGVGLSSFLLISFWYTRIEASLGALLAFFMNRIGDLFFLLAMFLAQYLLGSIDIFILISYPSFNSDIIVIFFLLAAMAKSAQISFHLWLPYSMEGKLYYSNYNRDEKGKFIKYSHSIKNDIDNNITQYQKQAILGLLLNDGYISGKILSFTFKSEDLDFTR